MPVSGEIMTGGGAARAGAVPDVHDEIVDAEFETVGAQPPQGAPPAAFAQASHQAETARPNGMEMLVNGPGGRDRRAGPLFWAFGAVLIGAAFWVSGGHALVRDMAVPAAPVAAEPAGLRIVGLRSRIDETGDMPILFVDGEAVNESDRPAIVPRIEIRVTGGGGGVTRYLMGTRGRVLAPGGLMSFSGRLETPIDGLNGVTAAFAPGEQD